VLFACDLSRGPGRGDAERVFESVLLEFELPVRARERAHALTLGVASNLKAIDERIEAACEHWRVDRLAAVDRNVLRVATFELLFERDTPAEVVIDEAVEIARRFGGAESPGFVNGVLDRIARARAAEGSAP
jgi:N utilization substance protein B